MRRIAVLCVVAALVLPAVSLPLAPIAARRIVIGRSVENRRITAIERGNFAHHRKVMVVGCIHGNECAGRAVIKRLCEMNVPSDLDLWLIPTMNPDGAEAGTRQNARGVDLNRNFSRNWEPIGEPWDTYHSGSRPFSEPESRVTREFVQQHRPDVTIWYHQAMSLVVKSGPRRHRHVLQRYANAVGLPLRDIGSLPGTAIAWQNHHYPGHIAFVVELPAGAMSRRSATRHARAVLDAGRNW